MFYKVCSKCNILKSYDDYHKSSQRSDGISHSCASCVNEYNRKRSSLDSDIRKRRMKHEKIMTNPELHEKVKSYSKLYYNSLTGRAKSLLKTTTRRSSKFEEVDNPVDIEFILEKLKVGKCEVTGIAFDYDNKFNTCKNPLSPSIDRVDSNKGYSKDNVRIVLWQYNLMRGELTDDQLFDIFGDYFRTKLGV